MLRQQAIVFVVDSADLDSLDAARQELHELLARPSLAGTPLLVGVPLLLPLPPPPPPPCCRAPDCSQLAGPAAAEGAPLRLGGGPGIHLASTWHPPRRLCSHTSTSPWLEQVLGNKNDLPEALSAAELSQRLELPSLRDREVRGRAAACSPLPPRKENIKKTHAHCWSITLITLAPCRPAGGSLLHQLQAAEQHRRRAQMADRARQVVAASTAAHAPYPHHCCFPSLLACLYLKASHLFLTPSSVQALRKQAKTQQETWDARGSEGEKQLGGHKVCAMRARCRVLRGRAGGVALCRKAA